MRVRFHAPCGKQKGTDTEASTLPVVLAYIAEGICRGSPLSKSPYHVVGQLLHHILRDSAGLADGHLASAAELLRAGALGRALTTREDVIPEQVAQLILADALVPGGRVEHCEWSEIGGATREPHSLSVLDGLSSPRSTVGLMSVGKDGDERGCTAGELLTVLEVLQLDRRHGVLAPTAIPLDASAGGRLGGIIFLSGACRDRVGLIVDEGDQRHELVERDLDGDTRRVGDTALVQLGCSSSISAWQAHKTDGADQGMPSSSSSSSTL